MGDGCLKYNIMYIISWYIIFKRAHSPLTTAEIIGELMILINVYLSQ